MGDAWKMIFKNNIVKFDGTNYDSWKEMMKTHLLCMGLGYWILKKITKTIITKKDLETCTKVERDLFMCNMRARDMNKFVDFKSQDGGILRVGNNATCQVKGIGSINLDDKTNIGDVYFCDGWTTSGQILSCEASPRPILALMILYYFDTYDLICQNII